MSLFHNKVSILLSSSSFLLLLLLSLLLLLLHKGHDEKVQYILYGTTMEEKTEGNELSRSLMDITIHALI